MVFKSGDCKDACIGTLLQQCNIADPGIFIFKDLRFTLRLMEENKDMNRPLELSYRVEEYIDDISKATNINFEFAYPDKFNIYLDEVTKILESGEALIVVVNHYDYEHSQFYKSLHMPHYIILERYENNCFTYLDPFPFYDKKGTFTVEELRQLTDCEHLESHRNVYLRINSQDQIFLNEEEYLLNHWENVFMHNIYAMLEQSQDGSEYRGIDAIRKMAYYLELWNNNDEIYASYRMRSRKFPVNSFLDVGGNRLGHANYIEKIGRLLRKDELIAIADQFKKISAYWNTVSSIRHMYQEDNIAGQYNISSDFIVNKLKKIPQLIRDIADKEEQALLELRKIFLNKKGAYK